MKQMLYIDGFGREHIVQPLALFLFNGEVRYVFRVNMRYVVAECFREDENWKYFQEIVE